MPNTCPAGPYNPGNAFVSSVAGNIGKVRARVLVWDHDPFMARPHNHMGFTFNKQSGREAKSKQEDEKLEFAFDSMFLRPNYSPQNMFVCTDKLDPAGGSGQVFDYVSSSESGEISPATDYLPPSAGGSENKHKPQQFQHELWVHVGNLFKSRPTLHPSEYQKSISETDASTQLISDDNPSGTLRLSDIQSAVKFSMVKEEEKEKVTYWPYQMAKQSSNGQSPVHWTLHKYTKVWQGCDFHIHIKKYKRLDAGIDPCIVENDKGQTSFSPECYDQENDQFTEPDLVMPDLVMPEWPSYAYLMYVLPSGGPVDYVHKISNEAYSYAGPDDTDSEDYWEQFVTSEVNARQDFWWLYKPYLLIEIGWEHPEHNYFIELVRGRKPRFIHLGMEWDHPERLYNDEIYEDTKGWKYMRKARVLSTYEGATTDALFTGEEFRIAVRHHLGKLIITFQGYESQPWVIARKDVKKGKPRVKEAHACIVPNGFLRLHGGNMSAKINFGYTKYPESGEWIVDDIQADSKNAGDSNLYISLTTMGNIAGENNPTENVMQSHFGNDKKVGPTNMKPGIDCDAYYVKEYMKNQPNSSLNVYQKFKNQYRQVGRGFVQINNNKVPRHIVHGKEHKVILSNRGKQKKFKFGQNDQLADSYDYKDYSSSFDVTIKLRAGSTIMPAKDEEWNSIFGNTPYSFGNVLTPIVNQTRCIVTGGSKPTAGMPVLDITSLVTNLTDHWTAEEFSSLEHEATLKCYMPIGVPMGTPETTAGQDPYALATAQELWRLHDKTFYVTIAFWWDTGVGLRYAPGNDLNGPEPAYNDPVLTQMTGLAFGGEFERSANKLFMKIKVKDYMDALKKQYIFNSPFFDAVSDTLAIYELAKLAGFDDAPNVSDFYPSGTLPKIDRRPLRYLQKVLENPAQYDYYHNGKFSRTKYYSLPAAYADLANPAVRFQNGEAYDSCMKKLAQYAGKTVYFDQYGVLKYENTPAYEVAFSSPNSSFSVYEPVFRFVTSPHVNIPPTPDDGGGQYLSDGFIFDPSQHAAHLVYNVVRYGRAVEDAVNTIVITSASKNIFGADTLEESIGGYIVEGHTFMEQLWEPDTEGFFGFRKAFYQSNGVFGDLRGVRNALLHYARMKYPPTYVTFETYGVPGLKALDIVTLDNELFYITDISHEIDPKENKWWMTIQGEWFKPFRGDTNIFGEPDVDVIDPSSV